MKVTISGTHGIRNKILAFKTYCGHGDEHEVDAVTVAEVWIVSILKVLPRIAGILHKVAKTSRSQNL
jgi:hypothetical protein